MRETVGNFRDPTLLASIMSRLARAAPTAPLTFMHVCGTHEHAIGRIGLRKLLPPGIRVVAGPGCPVCVCPPAEIDLAARLALEHDVTVATFGDMLHVPGRISLADAKAQGADIRVVRSVHDATELARQTPSREVAMLAIGFETTASTFAAAALAAPPANFSLLTALRCIPPALDALLALEGLSIDGFLLPGHVLTVAGTAAYEAFVGRSGIPAAVAGFEPVDVVWGLEQLVTQCARREARLVNAYARAVRPAGNTRAQELMEQAFETTDVPWRGLGTIPRSGLTLRAPWRALDARRRFGVVPDPNVPDSLPGCECGKVMVALKEPEECVLFGHACSPETPRGPCMVSAEGTCRSRYLYREPT